MATVVLAAAGAAIGGSLGGGLAGISSVAIGRLAGATAGRLIDQRLMGSGSEVVESGRVDRFRITGSAEGLPMARIYGRMRIAGQVIWSSRFLETVQVSGGGKGGPSQPKTREYSYSVSVAIALCEGQIARVGRVWADGVEISTEEITMRVYPGDDNQLPDPKIEAVEGSGTVPAYRGTAYVVVEDLDLGRFGNRIPQFNFEVVRVSPDSQPSKVSDYGRNIQAVAVIPGTGEYSLATSPVYYRAGPGNEWSANENAPSGRTDFVDSIDALSEELPKCAATSLIVSWFGSDLRAGSCVLRPKVESQVADGRNMEWSVSGETRDTAATVSKIDGRSVYGGTPADSAVVQAIQHLQEVGKDVMFYPFILMEQLQGNGLADPWSDAADQPILPWRGRLTLSRAPGQADTVDGTALAEAEVAAFFGAAAPTDFAVSGENVTYSGPNEWSYRRFILHYAALCKAAGGVHAFCIGSEMRGLTQIRGVAGFSAVQALQTLAADVRSLLGAEVKISYAADWSEYFGYHPQDGSADVFFHLDPLWADENIDFIGIDNYMPLSDWRDGDDHFDAQRWPSVHDSAYLMSNIEGGEGFDWYYSSGEARDAQVRSPIMDGAYHEPWIFRYKDLRSWWSNSHFERLNGERQATATGWQPQSKPIWFTEIGCAAIDKGTNQPNKFIDVKSSESALPYYSTGARDDLCQQTYIQAMHQYWNDADHNPISDEYTGSMVDQTKMFVWAWDARPFPFFPNNRALWSDGSNFAKGHWVNGRSGNRTLASVVEEICRNAGLQHYDVSNLFGVVRGYAEDQVSDARTALQPLMLRYGFDAIERDGILIFAMRGTAKSFFLDTEKLAVSEELEGELEKIRASNAELSGRVRLTFTQGESDFETLSEEAILPDEASFAVSHSELALSMTRAEGRQTVERWLAEARVSRETVRFALPPSQLSLGAGDVVTFAATELGASDFRIDRVEQSGLQLVEAVRSEDAIYEPHEMSEDIPRSTGFVAPVPVQTLLLDLPLMRGDEVEHAPHVAVTGRPWPGSVAIYDSVRDAGYALNTLISNAAIIGVTETPLMSARAGLVDRADPLQVKLLQGSLQGISDTEFLAGGNLAAIGDGQSGMWELFQFQYAELIDTDLFQLSHRLRGQLGTMTTIPDAWPVGSWFVLLNADVVQIKLASSLRNVAKHYRIGPAQRSFSDPSFTHYVEAFVGMGLKPYPPVHLNVKQMDTGALNVTWVRQTRIDGDQWETPEVPLGEETEQYQIRVRNGASVLRDTIVNTPQWAYSLSDQTADGYDAACFIEVAQVSARFGAGYFQST